MLFPVHRRVPHEGWAHLKDANYTSNPTVETAVDSAHLPHPVKLLLLQQLEVMCKVETVSLRLGDINGSECVTVKRFCDLRL